MHDSAGGGLIGSNRHLGRALVGNDHARGAHDLGRAHNGAKVAGIGHVVEHHHERGPFAGACNDIGKLSVREGANLKRDTLMRTVCGDGVELGAGTSDNGHAGRMQVVNKLHQRGIFALAFGHERTLDGKASTQGLGRRAATLYITARSRCGTARAVLAHRVPAGNASASCILGNRVSAGHAPRRPSLRARYPRARRPFIAAVWPALFSLCHLDPFP